MGTEINSPVMIQKDKKLHIPSLYDVGADTCIYDFPFLSNFISDITLHYTQIEVNFSSQRHKSCLLKKIIYLHKGNFMEIIFKPDNRLLGY